MSDLKSAYTTRLVDDNDLRQIVRDVEKPRAGDVLLARVDRVGHHKALELRDGRRAALYEGDRILVCYGNRYAPDQFEAEIGDDLSVCDLVAAGGVAANVLSRFGTTRQPTRLIPLGLMADEAGRVLNLDRYALAPLVHPKTVPTVAVLGTSMNAGKTTTAVGIIRAFRQNGLRVGAVKVTGTGAGGDFWAMRDAGAEVVLDFTSAGLVSTYKADPTVLLAAVATVIGTAMRAGIEALVIEVADGLYQAETDLLVRSDLFREMVDHIVFAARDAFGAKAGVDHIREIGLPVLAVSGALTQSPLAIREAESVTSLPVVPPGELGHLFRNLPVAEAPVIPIRAALPAMAAVA